MESLIGLDQRMVSTKVDLANQTLLTTRIREASNREVARMASLSLPQTGTWLSPFASTSTSPTGPEFVVAARFKLGMPHQTRPSNGVN